MKLFNWILFVATFVVIPSVPKSAYAQTCDDQLLMCKADDASCHQNLEKCETDKAALVAATPKAKPSGPAPKPDCAMDTVYDPIANACTCDEVDVQLHWKNDQKGVIVRVQRMSVYEGKHGNQDVYACVATRSSEINLHAAIIQQFKDECNVDATIAKVGPPDPERAALYPDSPDRFCESEKAYLHETIERKRDLDSGVDQKGEPVPLDLEHWLIVWNRVVKLAATMAEHERRLRHIEDTYCHQDAESGKWVNCPNDAASKVDLDFEAGIRAGYYWREKTTDSGAFGFDAMFTLWKGDYGAYVGGTGGWVKNPEQDRMIADMRLGFAYGGLCDLKNGEHTCVLRLGGVAHSEPILKYTNDVFGIAGEIGADLRPGGGLVSFGLALQAGGDRAAMYPPGKRVVAGTELYLAPTLFIGLNPM